MAPEGSDPRAFDPYRFRLDRDIRNTMSRALQECLRLGSADPLDRCMARWETSRPPAACRGYIEQRLPLYRRIIRTHGDRPGSPGASIAKDLWNHELYFECHEWLEPFWRQADGGRRQALQGLIQAAGAYVLQEAGRHGAAASLARKATHRLRTHGHHLEFIANIAALVSFLESGDLRTNRID